jgi:hypothetical protein
VEAWKREDDSLYAEFSRMEKWASLADELFMILQSRGEPDPVRARAAIRLLEQIPEAELKRFDMAMKPTREEREAGTGSVWTSIHDESPSGGCLGFSRRARADCASPAEARARRRDRRRLALRFAPEPDQLANPAACGGG